MAKGRKRKDSADENVEAYGYETYETETRENVLLAGLASYDSSKPKPNKYEYGPHIDPQLIWTGKAENTSFEVLTVSLMSTKK
ncbi:MAG: hypothetical protein AB1480_06820 [Nitrospirota bacterium]